jgi:acyl-CoA synthetase (AMP-forming)/AMP-acid ligase II
MKRSYAHRAWATSLLNDTIGGCLDKAATRWPDREAVVVRDQDVRMTFAELRHEADHLAAGLIALGLQPGDRVGLWSPNNIGWILSQYATAKAGLILVNLNPGYRVVELEYALNKVECRALITSCQFKTSDYIGQLRVLAPELDHCAPGALRSGLLPHLTTVIQMSNTDEPGFYTLDAVRRLGGPPELVRLTELPSFAQYDLSTLRLGFIGGSPCPIDVMHRIMDEMHIRDVAIIYGMTELSGGSTQTSLDDTLEQRVATIGRVQPHMEVKIADPEGRVVPLGTQGEICFRGYMVMRGYWNSEAETRETIDPARWLHSGDLGTMDEDGYITITGRSKDMVIRGGENIYPREIEEFLFTHPAVADVYVFGVPDDRFGEELCAWIRPRLGFAATEEEIRAFCRGRITHFKIPRYVRFVEAFPMTVTGKVQKFVMREIMRKELTSNAASNLPSLGGEER